MLRLARTTQPGREEVMGRHGVRAEMNDNGERWAAFCQTNELVIRGTLFPNKDCHKRTWISAGHFPRVYYYFPSYFNVNDFLKKISSRATNTCTLYS